MGQSSSTQKSKNVPKSTWRPEVLLTEAAASSDYDPIHIGKRRASESAPRQRGPNKKDINKAIKFAQDFLALHTDHDEANISVGTSPLLTMDIETFSKNKALTDTKVQEEIKRVSERAHNNVVFVKDLFNDQAGNIFKKFSFANQKEEYLQQNGKYFKVGSFARSQSTPDISKYVAEGAKNNQDMTENDQSTPKIGHDNEITPERERERDRASFHSHNSPDKKDKQIYQGFGDHHNDISAISVDQTKKQSISFRIESKDQSKASEEDIGFKAARPQVVPMPIEIKPEIQDNILIQNPYNDRLQQREVPTQGVYSNVQNQIPANSTRQNQQQQIQNQNPLQPQDYVQNVGRGYPIEEKAIPANNASHQPRKETSKSQMTHQNHPSKQWPSTSPKVERKDKKSKENIQTEKYSLKKQTRVASDKTSFKSSIQREASSPHKRAHRESQIDRSSTYIQRKKTEPLRQTNFVQQNNQTYKTNKVERSPMSRQDLKQGWPQARYDTHVHENGNYQNQQAPMQKHLETTPQRTNKWLVEDNKMAGPSSSPQFNVDVNPINVDLNLDELLRAADGPSHYGGYPHPHPHPTPVYMNYPPNYAMPLQGRFQEHHNLAAQYISPKHLDETAYYEENSQFGGRDNSLYHSRHDISQDMNDHSMDRGNQLNNSYMRRNKYGNNPAGYKYSQQTEFH